VDGCFVVLPSALADPPGLLHLRRAHVIYDVPAADVADLGLAGCRWCDSPYPASRKRFGMSPLRAHEAQCRGNPRRRLRSTGGGPTGGRRGPPPPVTGPSNAPPPAPTGALDLFSEDRSAWERARRVFLAAVTADADGWAPFVASPARTLPSVPPALRRAWTLLGADALAWAQRAPEDPLAWLWLLTLPSLIFHHPAPRAAAARPPLTHAARGAALLGADFLAALADRDAGVWRSPPSPSGRRQRARSAEEAGLSSPAQVTAGQRRALRLVRAGRLSAAARALLAAPVAPRTPAVWDKATLLFPQATPALASAAAIEGEFPDALEAATTFARSSGVPRELPREAVDDALRRAPRGTSPGPSGLRMEHLRALGESGQAALQAVVRLLAGPVAVRRVPPLAAHALAGADLLLLCKPGGADIDGLPRLRPIGMPEVLRKLAAAALAGTVRDAAARLLAPLQMGVGVPNPCERVVHELKAELSHHPSAALLQLDFRNAFNLISRVAAVAYLARSLPLLRPYLDWVYLGAAAPRVYGWAVPADAASGAAAALPRLWLPVERGVQQGDPLGPLIHAAAMHLAVLRLATTHPGAVVRAVHDDVVVVAPHSELHAVLRTAAEAGAAVDAELAPTKCAGWSPAGADAPVGWRARWCADGLQQFSVPLGTDAFVSASVDRLAADQSRLVAAIIALPAAELQ